MIRIIVETNDAGMAANVGGSVTKTYRTFLADIPELEAFMGKPDHTYQSRHVIGVEFMESPKI